MAATTLHCSICPWKISIHIYESKNFSSRLSCCQSFITFCVCEQQILYSTIYSRHGEKSYGPWKFYSWKINFGHKVVLTSFPMSCLLFVISFLSEVGKPGSVVHNTYWVVCCLRIRFLFPPNNSCNDRSRKYGLSV